jgi:hypothetical protein
MKSPPSRLAPIALVLSVPRGASALYTSAAFFFPAYPPVRFMRRPCRDNLLNGGACDASPLGGQGNDRLVFQDTGQLFGSGGFEDGSGFDMVEIVTWWRLKPLQNASLPSPRKAKFRLLMVGADL